MRAVGYKESLSIDNEQSLQDIDIPMPTATGKDILVAIKAHALLKSGKAKGKIVLEGF